MKNFPLRARPVAAQECATELYATSAKARAIDCSSMEIRYQCGKRDRRSDGKASARYRVRGILFAEISHYYRSIFSSISVQ